MDINSFSKLTYGVYIISSEDGEKKNAFVATAVFQVTAIPEKIAVAASKDNYTTALIQKKKAFGISVLKQHYAPITIGNFGFRSGRDFNKFEKCKYLVGKITGIPIVLEDTLSWFECILEQEIDLGTHVLFIGKVADCATVSEEDIPLTYQYYHEIKRGITPENAPSHIEKK
ncbi:MAG: flavin reductase family protein [Bacteroidales bacterium]|jgi:ferric-chelate reductase [NAD(P)H]|nr:flavin reductase family protein [Bacteroidales bacterium]